MQVARESTAERSIPSLPVAPTLSIIIPTFNEAANLPSLFSGLLEFVRTTNLFVETIVVDDSSPDGTGVLAEELAIKHNGTLSARVLHRPRKLGLSSALYDGIRVSAGNWVVMLDADNSHPTQSLLEMYQLAQRGADVVIGSRYVAGGRIEDWPLRRRLVSRGATLIARIAFHLDVKDPVSGFAILRRETAMRLPELLNPRTYKFLLELLIRVRPAHVEEVPIVFRDRRNGDSKLTPKEFVEFGLLVLALLRERYFRAASF